MANSWSKIALVLLVSFAAISCRGRKDHVFKRDKTPINKAEISTKMDERFSGFGEYSSKMNVKYADSKQSIAFSAKVRISRDSIIWISISPALGIEALRIMATRDSVFLMNKIDRTYYAGDYLYLKEVLKADVDFQMFQGILTGQSLFAQEDDNYEMYLKEGMLVLSNMNEEEEENLMANGLGGILKKIIVDPNEFSIRQQTFQDFENKKGLKLSNTSHTMVDKTLFADKIFVLLFDRDENSSVELDVSGIKAEKNQSFPFKIPPKYEPIR
jgi:hypothetical protein